MAWLVEGRRRLKIEMERAELDQAALAKELGWSQSKMSRIASAREKPQIPNADELETICRALNTSADLLLGLPPNTLAKRALEEARRGIERAETDMDAAERDEQKLPVRRDDR